MSYRLKKGAPEFQVTDGPLAGRKFVRGRTYEEIPDGPDAKRFERVPGSSPARAARAASKPKAKAENAPVDAPAKDTQEAES